MVRSEGNMSLKNPVTTPGIDPGTVRLVAQRQQGITVTKMNLSYFIGILWFSSLFAVKINALFQSSLPVLCSPVTLFSA
jgi:hypothetical protein